MINNDVVFGISDTDIVPINKNELNSRLGRGIDSDVINTYIEQYNQKVIYRYAYVRIPFECRKDLCYFNDEISIKSTVLANFLNDADEVILLAVSTGLEIDKLINKSTIQNPIGAFYIDAIASAGIESYIGYISNQICYGLNTTKRFSPGYADFPLEFQSYLLERLSAKETLGIMLSKDYLMIPTKSITAVIGIKQTKGVWHE